MTSTTPHDPAQVDIVRQPAAHFRLNDTVFSLLLLAPALIILSLVVLYPLVRGVLLSFQSYNLVNITSGAEFIRFQNYKVLLNDPAFMDSWRTTAYFVFISVVGQFILGFGTALVLNQKIWQRDFFRGVILIPWIVPTVVAALLWKWIFNQQYGVFNHLLASIGLITEYQAWIGNPDLALPAVILVNIWRGFPFHMIILLAALQTLPNEVLEAAIIDGASVWQRFIHIVLPLMRYIIMIDLLISIIFSFQQFTLLWIMTEGGPVTATSTLSINIYRAAFQSFDFGIGAAIGTMWLVVLTVFSVLFIRFAGGTGRNRY
jgi:multiple sugar transport system permease protein